MAFQLHPRLAADTFRVGSLPLSRVLLMNDANYPWCILVPERDGMREIFELEAADRRQLLDEIAAVSRAMAQGFNAGKMNVAALGNVVPQLHVHVIVRCDTDPAWPAPVWGRVATRPYSEAERHELLVKLVTLFDPIPGFRTHL